MKQTGIVVGLEGSKAKIRMQRHTACGDCGACHVTENQLKLTLEAENIVGAKEGDLVEVDMENLDFLSAVVIVYLFPLIALIAGIFAGYYGLLALDVSDSAAQGFGALIGILTAALTYFVIRANEEKLQSMKKYKPVISSIVNKK